MKIVTYRSSGFLGLLSFIASIIWPLVFLSQPSKYGMFRMCLRVGWWALRSWSFVTTSVRRSLSLFTAAFIRIQNGMLSECTTLHKYCCEITVVQPVVWHFFKTFICSLINSPFHNFVHWFTDQFAVSYSRYFPQLLVPSMKFHHSISKYVALFGFYTLFFLQHTRNEFT